MGQLEIEQLLHSSKQKMNEREISEAIDIRLTNVNRCLKQMLKSHQIFVEKQKKLVRARNNHFYLKEVKYWYIKKSRKSK